eukprot:TRINITY_DN19072_c0_g1_i1.p1 TRINITY_DN19072_c0_g1~~TRINITY_DN19072_c0_g1_i1.p1  ORF type:complete len:614 (+),score=96.86 TRINITY_DN19072_c0_g1_i1:184-2025(+)
MITYQSGGGLEFLRRICQREGSVFLQSMQVSIPCALTSAGMKVCISHGLIPGWQDMNEDMVLLNNAAWSGFSFLVGFLIVFRTSQAYARFWDGCTSTHMMRAEWFDACSAAIAFCKHSDADVNTIFKFKHTLIRLFSLLHAVAVAEIEDSSHDELDEVNAFRYELVDVESLDQDSLNAVRDSETKVELVFMWIQQLIVENIRTGVLSIPPPILSRVFQELANGMVQFHDALKISTIPFPFPYAQTCDLLLLIHWMMTPVIIVHWCSNPLWAFVFSFIQVFILWSLNFIAVEIENPFGTDPNDIDAMAMQLEMNRHLILLVSEAARATPNLVCKIDPKRPNAMFNRSANARKSLHEAWFKKRDSDDVSSVGSIARSSRKSERRGDGSMLRVRRGSVRHSNMTNESSLLTYQSVFSNDEDAGSRFGRLSTGTSRARSVTFADDEDEEEADDDRRGREAAIRHGRLAPNGQQGVQDECDESSVPPVVVGNGHSLSSTAGELEAYGGATSCRDMVLESDGGEVHVKEDLKMEKLTFMPESTEEMRVDLHFGDPNDNLAAPGSHLRLLKGDNDTNNFDFSAVAEACSPPVLTPNLFTPRQRQFLRDRSNDPSATEMMA